MNFFEIEEKEKEIAEKTINEYNKINKKDFYIEINIPITITRYNLHGFMDNTLIEVDEFYFKRLDIKTNEIFEINTTTLNMYCDTIAEMYEDIKTEIAEKISTEIDEYFLSIEI